MLLPLRALQDNESQESNITEDGSSGAGCSAGAAAAAAAGM